MKRLIIAVAVGCSIWAGSAAIATAVGQPEIDRANATIQVSGSKFEPIQCVGVDGVNYVTYLGSWKGGETDVTPGFSSYNLTGSLTVSKIEWTINLATGRGVLRGTAALRSVPANATAAEETYRGPLTLITQGVPTGQAEVPARGWINANTYTSNARDGGSLLANVEFQINSAFGAVGHFGDAAGSYGIPNYSVTTNNVVC